MKVLKIVYGDDAGGVFICESNFIKYWRSQSILVDSVVIGDGKALSTYEEISSNVQKIPAPYVDFSGNGFTKIKQVLKNYFLSKKISDLVVVKDYDAVIFRRANFLVIGGLLGQKMNVKPYWHMPNAVNSLFGKAYYNFLINKYSIIPVANSKYTSHSLNKDNNYVIYPGYNPERICHNSNNIRTKLGINNEDKIFGIASRLHRDKAQDLIIKAFKLGNLSEKNAHLVIAGTTDDERYLSHLKKLSEGESNIHFTGYINDMTEFYSGIDIYINSRRNVEPFGISLSEALASGIPVIAYYKGGPEEMVKNDVTGWLFYELDVGKISDLMKNALIANLNEMGSAAKKSAKKFDSKLNAKRFLDIISS